jgi:hypothetical protein
MPYVRGKGCSSPSVGNAGPTHSSWSTDRWSTAFLDIELTTVYGRSTRDRGGCRRRLIPGTRVAEPGHGPFRKRPLVPPGRNRTCDSRFRNSVRLYPVTCEDDSNWHFDQRVSSLQHPIATQRFPASRGTAAGPLRDRRRPLGALPGVRCGTIDTLGIRPSRCVSRRLRLPPQLTLVAPRSGARDARAF